MHRFWCSCNKVLFKWMCPKESLRWQCLLWNWLEKLLQHVLFSLFIANYRYFTLDSSNFNEPYGEKNRKGTFRKECYTSHVSYFTFKTHEAIFLQMSIKIWYYGRNVLFEVDFLYIFTSFFSFLTELCSLHDFDFMMKLEDP